jgi:hypothetical protein
MVIRGRQLCSAFSRGSCARVSYHRYPVIPLDAILLPRKSFGMVDKGANQGLKMAPVEISCDFGRPIAALLREMP